jgi:hypothetical protein
MGLIWASALPSVLRTFHTVPPVTLKVPFLNQCSLLPIEAALIPDLLIPFERPARDTALPVARMFAWNPLPGFEFHVDALVFDQRDLIMHHQRATGIQFFLRDEWIVPNLSELAVGWLPGQVGVSGMLRATGPLEPGVLRLC